MGLHRGLVNRLCWGAARFPFVAGEVCVQKTKVSFVDAIAEIFAPLVNGVPLVLVDDAVQSDPRALLELMGECDASRITLVPSLLDALLTLGDDLAQVVPKLKLWFVSGELLTPQLARRFAAAVPGATLSTSTVPQSSVCRQPLSCGGGRLRGPERAHRSAHREPARLCAQSASAGSCRACPACCTWPVMG